MYRMMCALLVLVLICPTASAAPAYGTKMPKQKEFFSGIQHYEIMDRHLKNDQGDMRSRQEHVLLSYGVTDWLSLDLKASMGTIEHKAASGDRIKYKDPVWGGGYGFRIRLYEGGPVKIVTGFQHISIHPKTREISGVEHNAILDDWQGSALISYDLKKCTPYTGVRYGVTDYIHRQGVERKRISPSGSRRTDMILGVDIPLGEKVWVNLEGAAGTGSAVATSLNFRF